jgi:hypothetical protein
MAKLYSTTTHLGDTYMYTRVRVKSGSWAGSVGKVLNSIGSSTLLMQLENQQYRRIRVPYEHVEVIKPEKQAMPSRHIGPLDFSNPYTEEE